MTQLQPAAELSITEQGWTGWSREQPAATERRLRVVPGDAIALGEGWECELTIVAILPASLTIKSTGRHLVVQNADGSIPLMGPYVEELAVPRGTSVSLVTPTMDGGCTWTIAVERIETETTG